MDIKTGVSKKSTHDKSSADLAEYNVPNDDQENERLGIEVLLFD